MGILTKQNKALDGRKLLFIKRSLFQKSPDSLTVTNSKEVRDQIKAILKNDNDYKILMSYISTSRIIDLDKLRKLIAAIDESNCVTGKHTEVRCIYGQDECVDVSPLKLQNASK